jgi:membrane-associated protease RseP (regulator of RpoE activity)
MSEIRFSVTSRVSIFLLSLLVTGSTASGATGGVGIVLASQEGWLTILQVTENGPAGRAGLLSGDKIAKIEGKPMRNVALQDAVGRLIGPEGEKVTLTILRQVGSKTDEFDVTLTREVIRSRALPLQLSGKAAALAFTPTKEAQQVEWHGHKIVSRVLPYPDLVSLLIRLPIAHAVATGQGVKVALIQYSTHDGISAVLKQIAPGAQIHEFALTTPPQDVPHLTAQVKEAGCRVAVIADVDAWPDQALLSLARALISDRRILIVPSDFSEDTSKIETINALQSLGALTVGRVNAQSLVMETMPGGTKAFNQHIRRIKTDVFSTVESQPTADPRTPAVTAAGVAALVLERWPHLRSEEVRRRIVDGARRVWQGTSVETGQWMPCSTDPVTTKFVPMDEKAVFRFRMLDAAAALDVDTEAPWFLNMLNCPKAWEVTKGKGSTVAVTDGGFHLQHPDLAGRIQTTGCFGPSTFAAPDQNFHGTEMSRLVLAIAPEAQIILVLCSRSNAEDLASNVAQSFEFAVQQKADVISSSWSAQLNKNEALLAAVRQAADSGVVVSWFHYPEPYPGILRPDFAYAWWRKEKRLGFSDRFLINPPEFHPVEIEAGLSNTAPQAAGLAALVKSVNPTLTPPQIVKLISENSDPVGESVLIPDAYRIVQAARSRH